MIRIRKILRGDFLHIKFWKDNMRYLVLLFVLFFLMVLLNMIGTFKVAEIAGLRKDINELREHSVYLSAEIMQMTRISEVYKEVEKRELGLKKLSKPPLIIEVDTRTKKK